MGCTRTAYRVLVGRPLENWPLERPQCDIVAQEVVERGRNVEMVQ
jgi:hypothetical protein